MTKKSAVSTDIHTIAEDRQGTPGHGGAAVQLNGSDEEAKGGDTEEQEEMERAVLAEDVPPIPEGHPEGSFHACQVKLIPDFIASLQLENQHKFNPRGPFVVLGDAIISFAKSVAAPLGGLHPFRERFPPALRDSVLFDGPVRGLLILYFPICSKI